MRNFKSIAVFLTLLFSTAAQAELLCPSGNQNSALVIIDMQSWFYKVEARDELPANQEKLKQVVNEQIAAIKRAEAANVPIIFVESALFGKTDSALKDAIGSYGNVTFIKKSTNGLFEDTNTFRKDIIDYLTTKKIGTLVVVGANGGTCVRKSIEGALAGNCSVIVDSKGVIDFNFESFVYPYDGHYKDLKSNCQGCSLKEVSDLEKISFVTDSSTKSSTPKATLNVQ